MASKACSECGEMMRWAMGQDKWVCPVCGHEERDSANSRACNVEPEPRVDGYGQEWYIRLKDGQVWRKRGTKEQMERLGKWLADRIGTQVEFIQPTGLNSRACNSSNPVVQKAMNGCAATNANAPMWINDYKNQLKRMLADLDLEATQTFALLRDYGKAARDSAKDGAKNDEWRELEKIGARFIPELRKAANIIQGLKREADAL